MVLLANFIVYTIVYNMALSEDGTPDDLLDPQPLITGFSWSPANNHLTLTSSTGLDPTTVVTLVLENADNYTGGWTVRAYTNRGSGWRKSEWVSLNTSSAITSTSINIVLGSVEVPSYGQNESFIMYIEFKNPSGVEYATGQSLSCQITNEFDSTGPLHSNAAWSVASTFSLPTGSGSDSTASRSMYWDVSDTQSGIAAVSANTSVGTLVSDTSEEISTGLTRYTYTLTINGTQALSNSSVNVTFSATNGFGTTTYGTALEGSISMSDMTAPSVVITKNGNVLRRLKVGGRSRNRAMGNSFEFTVSDEHSSISSVTVTGNDTTATDSLVQLQNLGDGKYKQKLTLRPGLIPDGGSQNTFYTISATDSAGNTGHAYASRTIQIYDYSVPTASIDGNTDTITFYTSDGNGQSAYKDISFTWSPDEFATIDTSTIEIIKESGEGYWSNGSWSDNTYSGRWNVSQSSISVGTSSTEIIYARVSDDVGTQGTSSNFQFTFANSNNSDNIPPGITVEEKTVHTFMTSSSSTDTQTGYVWWSVTDADSGINMNSVGAEPVPDQDVIISVQDTSPSLEHGSMFKTTYTMKRIVGLIEPGHEWYPDYLGRHTHFSQVLRLKAEDNAGNEETRDIGFHQRYIDDTKPFFDAPEPIYYIFYTNPGNVVTATMSVSVPVEDTHSILATGSGSYGVVKKSGTGSNNWSEPTDVSLELNPDNKSGLLHFSIPLAASVLSANSVNVPQTVTMTITDVAGMSKTQDWTGYVTLQDNTPPLLSGPVSITGYDLTTGGDDRISKDVDLTVSDPGNRTSYIVANGFLIEIEDGTGITTSGVTRVTPHGSTWRYTVSVPRNNKSLVSSSTDFGYTRVTAQDNYGNTSTLETTHYGTYKDTTIPTINNAQLSGNFDFDEYSLSTTFITKELSFSCLDEYSTLNEASVTSSNPQVTIGDKSRTGDNYIVPITLTRAGLMSNSGATVLLNVSDTAGNVAETVTVSLAGSYIDNNGTVFSMKSNPTDNIAPEFVGIPAIGSEAPSNLSLTTESDDNERIISIDVEESSDIVPGSLTVEKLGGNGIVSDASYNSSTDNISFKVTTRPSDYSADNVYVDEQFRITIADVSENTNTTDVSYKVRVEDVTSPVLTLVQDANVVAVSLNQSENGVNANLSINIRATDLHTGINVSSFSLSEVSGSNRLYDAAGTTFTVNGDTFTVNTQVTNTGVVGTETIQVSVSVEDNAGNLSSIEIPINITIIDDVAPVISIVNSPTDVNVYSSNNRLQAVNVIFTVTDTSEVIPVEQVVVTETSSGDVAVATDVQSVIKSETNYTLPIIVNAQALGHNQTETLTYVIVAQDSVGNSSQETDISFTVKSYDDVDPVVTATGSIDNFSLNNTTTINKTVTATFSISDNLMPTANLTLSKSLGWIIRSRNNGSGIVILEKEFTYNDEFSGPQEVSLTAFDSAGNYHSATHDFVISKFDFVKPGFVNVTVKSNEGANTRVNSNTMNPGITISGKVTDSGSGIDPSTLKIISSNSGTIASGNTMSPTSFDVSSGEFNFDFNWNYNDERWSDLWSNNGSVVFSEDFVIQVADYQSNTQTHDVSANLIRDDLIAPTLSISSVNINDSSVSVSSSNPINLEDGNTFTDSVDITIDASDSQSGLNQASWSLTLSNSNTSNVLTFSSANGDYNENNVDGLTVTPGTANNYEINMGFHASSLTNELLVSQYGNNELTLTLSVSDNNGQTSIVATTIVINRVDVVGPTIGALQAITGELNSINLSESSVIFTHQIKVSVSDNQSGIASVVMNNDYDANGTGIENGTLFYYFKRIYKWTDISSELIVSDLKATATDNQGNVSNSGSGENVTITAINNDSSNIDSIVTYTQIDLNTQDTSSITNEMIVTITTDDYSGITVNAIKGNITKTLTQTDNNIDGVYSTSIVYNAADFSLGDTIENWSIEVIDSNDNDNTSTSSFPEITISKKYNTDPIISSVKMNMADSDITEMPLDVSSSSSVVVNTIITVSDAQSTINTVTASVANDLPIDDLPSDDLPVTIGTTTTNGSGLFTIPLTLTPSAVGLYANYQNFIMKITIVAIDSAGNISSYVKYLPIYLDDYTPPVISNVTVNNVISPTIELQSIEAIELDASNNEGQSLLGEGNLVTLYTDSSKSQPYRARLKITAQVSHGRDLKAGNPSISQDITGWSLSNGTSDGIYVWQKDVSSVTPGMVQINTTVNATDTADVAGTPKTATFNIDFKDNTRQLISMFEMSGIVEVNEIPTISLRASSSSVLQDTTIKLGWSDNGTTIPVVTIVYGSPTILAETLTASVTNAGENIYYKSFDYNNFNTILPAGQIIPITISATVSDDAGNVSTQSLTANMALVDDTKPLIKTYDLTGGTTVVNRSELTFGNTDTHIFTSSANANANGILYLEASVTAEGLRGIASIAVSSSPVLTWIEDEVSSGVFHANISYDNLNKYSTSYPYTITTVVTDIIGQSATESKTIAFSKRDDINQVATVGTFVGLTNGVALMKTSDLFDKILSININVNENMIGTMGTALLEGQGSNIKIDLTSVSQALGSVTRVYSYDVTLDRSDYLSTTTDEEILSFSIIDAHDNSSLVTQTITIPVELEDDGAPIGSISSSVEDSIDGGFNKVNLTFNTANGSKKIYIYASFNDIATGIDPDTIGIITSNANLVFNRSYDAGQNQATFDAQITSNFYASLLSNDSYENIIFTVECRDNNSNLLTMPITIGFKRSSLSPPEITNFALSNPVITHLSEHTDDDEKTIKVILFAAFARESGISDQYVTYTKNGVAQGVRLQSEFNGIWSELTFVSVKPEPFNPNATDDVYVFTLHCADLNNQESTADATLTVKYDDINNPVIHSADFYENDAVISQKVISTDGHQSQYGISKTLQFKARLSDLGDDIDQLTVALDKNGDFSNAAITDISRVANKFIDGYDYAVFNVELTPSTSWSSSLQTLVVVLTVTNTIGNSINLSRNLGVAIADELSPVIHSLSLECFGQNGNNLQTDPNISYKAGFVRGEMIVYDDSGLDISSASLVSSDDRVFSNIGNQSAGTINSRNATKITFNLMVNYDDQQLNLGANTLTATANINDTAGQAATPVTSSCTIDKLDELAPQILGLAFVEDSVTSVKDEAWSTHKIQGTGNANMQGQKSLSSWIVIDTTIPTSTAEQVLLSVGGQEDEHTLIMAINNHRFTVHAGLNKNETVLNKSATLSWDMRDGASTNPLHQFINSGGSVELALLVRLDIGVIMLYANGRLIAAEQARERSFIAYGGTTPTLSVGKADPEQSNRSLFADVSGDWQGTISAFNIYDWSSGGVNKVAHESSVVIANVSNSKTTANGKVVFANLDNEQTTFDIKENGTSLIGNVSTFANVSTFNKSISYDQGLGNDSTDIPYLASSTQSFDNSYSDSETLTIRKVNTAVTSDLVITHETANGGPTVLDDSDIVILGSSSTESLLIAITADENATTSVADTESFSITVGGTTLSTTKLAGSGLQHRLVLDLETLNGISGTRYGDYTLAISANVSDDSEASLAINKNLTIRAVDENPPIITGAVFNTGGLVSTGNLEDDDLYIDVSVSSASPSAEVDMTVKFTDNSHNLTSSAAISITPIGTVYDGGPSVFIGSNDNPRGFTVVSTNANNGVYQARIKRTFVYSELSSTGSHQYKTDELNYENWTITVTDGNNQSSSKNFTINVNVVNEVFPTTPSISLNTDNIVLSPGTQENVIATIITGNNNNINISGVELLSSTITTGNHDIYTLVSNATITNVTPANPDPANKKVFTAEFSVDYSNITGTYSIPKEYKIGAKITDLANNESLILDGARLEITRSDNEAPQIVYTKRYNYSTLYSAYSALTLNGATYNSLNINTAAAQPDLRFSITDNDALNVATIKMFQSLPIEASSTNPRLETPEGGVYSNATEIAMNLVSGVYEPATPISFNPANFSKLISEGYSYYVWIRVQAEDMTQNKTEIHIPFKVNKLIDADPTLAISVNTTQRNGTSEVTGVASGFVTHEAASIVRANLRSDSTHAVVQVRVIASDNDNVKAVGTAPTDNVIQSSATGPIMIGGVSTYTIERVYSFNTYNHVGDTFIENFYVIIEDESENTTSHLIPVHINGQDIIAPSINVTMSTEGNNGSTELKYPGDTLTIVVSAEITGAGSGVDVNTVELTGANGYTSLGLVQGKYTWTKLVTWFDEQPNTNVTENISIQSKDNDGNIQIVESSLVYSVTNNMIMTLVSGSAHLEEDGTYNLITDTVKSVDPAKTYNVKFVWEIDHPNELLTPSNTDVEITGDSDPTLVGDVTKVGTVDTHTYTAIVAIDTNNMNKGQNNTISIKLTSRDQNTQVREHTLTQDFYVWDYETIDEANDYYIMYAANINPSITKITNNDGVVVAYKMNARSTAFTNVSAVQVNYPTGQVRVEAEPFEIIQYAVGSTSEVISTDNFKVEANVYADSNGTVDAEVILEDKNVTISYVDDYTLAQIIYSNINDGVFSDQLTVSANTPDQITRTYTKEYLLGNPVTKAMISARVYDQGLQSSTPSVGIVDLQEITDNRLDQIAYRNGTFGQNDIMQEGDILVLSGTSSYERKVTDIYGTEHTLVSETPIKLLLRQTATARYI